MPNPEKYDPEKQARELIESLGDTPAGKEFLEEGESALKDKGVLASKPARVDARKYIKSLNKDLLAYIEQQELSKDDKAFTEQAILSGDYRDIIFKLKKDLEDTHSEENHEKLVSLLEQLEDPLFKLRVRISHQEAFRRAGELLDKNKELQDD